MNHAAIRRILHASSALVLLLALHDAEGLLRYVLAGCAVAAVVADSLRIARPAFGSFVIGLVPVFRTSELARVSGATWLCIGYALAAWFPQPAATAGILVGALADPAASWVGSRIAGLSKKKTWAGSGAAAVVAAAALLALRIPCVGVVVGTTGAAVLERWPGPLNDNLVVAPGVALVVWLSM